MGGFAARETGLPLTHCSVCATRPLAVVRCDGQHGVDMFADKWDNAPSTGPHGGADGTLPRNTTRKLVVQHDDFAWRCHEDCGWGAFAHWQSTVCRNASEPPAPRSYGDPPTTACRHDITYNEPFWDQQVSGGFYYNGTAKAEPWAPGWTSRKWAKPSTGVVHMYHSARWGGWQFQLGARNDTDSTLQFMCTLIEPDPNATIAGLWRPVAGGPVPCPKPGEPHAADAVVHGGWQEARGGAIGPQYTAPEFNNSYFVENIKEELDYEGEWFLDLDEGSLYLVPPGAGHPSDLDLVPVHSPRSAPVQRIPISPPPLPLFYTAKMGRTFIIACSTRGAAARRNYLAGHSKH